MEITGPGWLFVCHMRAGREEAAGAGRLFVCLFGGEEWGRRLGTGDFLVCHSLAIWSSIAEPLGGLINEAVVLNKRMAKMCSLICTTQ